MPDVVIQWNNVLLETIRKFGGAPCPIARAGAMMHVAMHDAINAIIPTHQPYLREAEMPSPPPSGASAEAAGVCAAYRVLCAVYPKADLKMLFDNALQTSLSQIPDGQSKNEGCAFGEAVGQAIVNLRMGDGSENPDLPLYNPGNQPGDWRPTGSGSAATPNWPRVKPFTRPMDGDLPVGGLVQFRPPLPGNYQNMVDLLRSTEYAAQFEDVKKLGSANSTVRTTEQRDIAFFWANDIDGTYKPPGHLFRITQLVSDLRRLSLIENARLFALVGLVMADAGIVAWDAKYSTAIDLWRPESAIRLADTDSNLLTEVDPNWQPLSVNQQGQRFSPPFPAYVSGHATFGAAHSGIMRNFFGTDNVTFTADTDDPMAEGVKRTFNSFSSAALENGRSRVYLGVHFQWDADHGYISGTNLADYVFANSLKPLSMC